MKLVIIGLGSIGRRYVELLKPTHELKAFRSGTTKAAALPGVAEVHSWNEVEVFAPDAVFITNPTSLHIPTAFECAKRNLRIFLEKPLGHDIAGLEPLLKLIQEKKLVTYLAYSLRFHPVIHYLKTQIQPDSIDQACLVCRTHLGQWRKGVDPKTIYSAHRHLGGGVLLDLSHEIDLAEYLFGPLGEISGSLARRSQVTVDAEDYAALEMQSNHMTIKIELDCAWEGKNERYIDLHLKTGGHLHADLLKNEVHSGKETVAKFNSGIQETYAEQLEYFFQNSDNPNMMNHLAQAAVLFKKICAFRDKAA